MQVHYFGCQLHCLGHKWHGDVPWRPTWEHPVGAVDGRFAPRIDGKEAPQGEAALVHTGGYTLIAYWDRSGDSRPNSNSVFAAEGEHTFEELLAAAKEQWAWVFKRQSFDVRRRV
jgi:hypothetical protein